MGNWWMLRNSAGRPDAMLTLTVASVVALLLKILVAGVVVAGVSLGAAPDSATVGLVLGPLIAGYVSRRNGIGGKGIPSHEEKKPDDHSAR